MMHFEVKTDIPFKLKNSDAKGKSYTDKDPTITEGRQKVFKRLTDPTGDIQTPY